MRKQLLTLAESPLRRWNEEVQSIANLVGESDDSDLRESFVSLVLQLTLEQPLKTPFVATVVLFVNTIKPEIAGEVLARLSASTEETIREGKWRDVKLYLRLAACLQGCMEGEGVFPVLEALFARAVEQQTASSDDVSIAAMTKRTRKAG